jgi:sugar lactone lactonase YvrE
MNTQLKSSTRVPSRALPRHLCLNRRHWLSNFRPGLLFALILVAACVAVSAPAASAQVTFAGAQRIVSSAFVSPGGIALDASGNLFVSDSNANTITELTAADGYNTANILASAYTASGGFKIPAGLAVDATGNVFVADYGHAAVKEILAAGGYTTVNTVGSGFTLPSHLAVDTTGNVFVADIGNSAIEEIVAAGGYTTVKSLVSTFAPGGVAVDGSGNVFFSDLDASVNPAVPEVREILAAGGYTKVNTLAGAYTSGGGFDQIEVLALDKQGNVFVADAGSDDIMSGPKQGLVKEILIAGGYETVNTLASGLNVPTAVAPDGRGNIFFNQFNSGSILELQTQSVNFGDANVCPSGSTTPAPCSATQTLTFNVAAGTTIGSVYVLTLGAQFNDFQPQPNDTSTTLCTPQTYPSATTCTVDVTFAPLYAGERNGAVEILDGSGNLLASTTMYGLGTASTIAFTPSNQLPLLGGPGFSFGQPSSISMDGSGNLFVADFGKDAVYQMLVAGGYTTVKSLGGTFAFGGPSGAVVDGAGNVFVSDFTNKAIYEIQAAGGYMTVNTLAGGFAFTGPSDIALDGNGNVFVTDVASAVYEIPAFGGYATVIPLATGFPFNRPTSVAVDANDNVFLTDIGNKAVYEILAAGGYTTVNRLASGLGLSSPLGVAVNASGNVFVADGDYPTIFELLQPSGYVNALQLGRFTHPWSVAPAPNGDVYVTDIGNGGTVPASVQLIQRSQPPPLNFAPTRVGGTSSDSPKSVQIEDVGNQLLTGTGSLGDALDFISVPGSGAVPDCDGTLSLIPGNVCNVSLSFTPQSAGPLSSALTLSDNSLNGAPAVQTIPLSGTGQVLQVSGISPNYGAPAALVHITGTGFGATQGGSTVTVGGALSYVSSWSNTAITLQVPSKAATGNIIVTVSGVPSNGVGFTFYPYPAIATISPTSGPVGTPVTITGAGLLDGGGNGVVTFNGTPAAIISQSPTSLQVNVPTGATTGLVSVHVNGITVKTSSNFTVTSSQLSIGAISPNYGAPASLIHLTGTGFGATQGTSSVTVGGALAYVPSWSNTAITVQVPSKASTGNIVVTVGGVSSNGAAFTFYPYPAIATFSPTSAEVGTPVTIAGTGLLDGGSNGVVTFNGVRTAILSQSPTSLQVNVPAGATTGPVSVAVNGVTVKSASNFTVLVPQVSAITPGYGAPSAVVEIAGANFGASQGNSYVTIGGIGAGVVAWSDTSITIRVPSNASAGGLAVRTGGGIASGAFTFYPYPAIASISPASGPVGTTVTITGTGLLDGGNNATVTFNGTPATIVSETSTQIQVNVPAGATSGRLLLKVNGVTIVASSDFIVTP